MSDFLDRMATSSRARSLAAQLATSQPAMLDQAMDAPAPLSLQLDRFDLIAELKLRSPAAGELAVAGFDPKQQLDAYAQGGAAAVSVLTEPDEFLGSLEIMSAAAAQLRPAGIPVMRKDFLVDSYQVAEARAHGASGVLLIAAMLSDADLDEMLAISAELGLFVLIEAFDDDDLARIGRLTLPPAANPILVGVNSRNLKTLAVDFERFALLADAIRDDVPKVAESGINSTADIETVAGLGYSLALVGSALMRDGNAASAVVDFVAAGRASVTNGQTVAGSGSGNGNPGEAG